MKAVFSHSQDKRTKRYETVAPAHLCGVVMEAADTEAIKGLVETGFGYSMLPEYALKQPSKFFHTMRIEGKRLFRHQALAMPITAQPRALTEAVAMFLKTALDTQTPRGTNSTAT